MIHEITKETLANAESVWSCPVYRDGDVVLRDGPTVRVRVMRGLAHASLPQRDSEVFRGLPATKGLSQ